MKHSTNNICIFGKCEQKEKCRSLAGYPYCYKHFWFSWVVIKSKDNVSQIHTLESIWYWITWILIRKYT